MDMAKRFLEIEVNVDGNTLKTTETRNYKLFCDLPLEICKNKTFMNKHFGQYPVLPVDYTPLTAMRSYDAMLALYAQVLEISFSHHAYLIANSTLWKNHTQKAYFTRRTNVTEEYIINGFRLLSRLLYKNFGRKIIVLIDEYDVYINSLFIVGREEKDKIKVFLGRFNREFLNNNIYLDKALLTGVIPVDNKIYPLPNNITEYIFLKRQKFFNYYGINEMELNNVFMSNLKNDEKKKKLKEIIDDECDNYVLDDEGRRIYGTWSVLNYFENITNIENHIVI
uniref:AAA-ATPase-like domain-containing protein n=1 Tax=Clastoptera arizonana TaxID=38151 RepID=A0A1B6E926_9HEMI